MPDHKFEQKADRQRTTLDFKQRIIDLMANSQPLPNVGIYDEPVRYFKANEQWCAVIFGWLDWLEDIAGWQAAEDENYQGIQQILIFEEGIEPLVTTQAELKAAICEGIECAVVQISKRIVSGSKTGFSIDDDGNIIIGDDGDDSLPEDDPLTLQDEEAMALDGQARKVASGFQYVLDRLNELYTTGVPLAEAKYVMTQEFYANEPEMESAVENWYTRATASQPLPSGINEDALAQNLYCDGNNRVTLNTYLIDTFSEVTGTTQAATMLVAGLSDEQFNDWKARGGKIPSTAYIAYTCTPFETEIIIFSGADLTGSAYKTGSVVNKINHRVLIEVEGKIPDTAGGIQDFFWRVAGDGTKTFIGTATPNGTGQVNENWTWPTALQVPFRSDGKYVFTRDTVSSGATFLEIRRKLSELGTGGSFTMKITDLGEV